MDIRFRVEGTCPDTHARRGRFRTAHGEVETPVFMPVGTQGVVKTMTAPEIADLGAKIILGNTYHLAVRPGEETLKALGGMHRMYGWQGSILTDSGGFQMLSLAALRKVDERGVRFRNHLDGDLLDLTPERSIALQEAIGSDIMMCLDHLEASTKPRAVHEAAMARTTRWALRCLAARQRPEAALFGIVQGGVDLELRTRHVEELCAHDFDGFAIGGLSVGESIEKMDETLLHTAPRMPQEKPRYLMGVGTPRDLVEGVAAGVDMFDCVMPTRNARKGGLFVAGGTRRLNIKLSRLREETGPIDPECGCPTCRHYSAGYLRHLFLVKEPLVQRLLSVHNLHIYIQLMVQMRQAIREGRFAAFRADFHRRSAEG